MPRRLSDETTAWLLVAGATVLILFAQRRLWAGASADSELEPAPPAPGKIPGVIAQPGHGPPALNPSLPSLGATARIPWTGWKDILWRTYQHANDDRLLATAAGVVFYGLLAIFPAVTALVSSYGLFADPATIGANLQTLSLMLPDGSFGIVQDQIARVLAKDNAALGATFLFGLAFAIWSANAGVKAVIDALNVVCEERERRGFVRLNLTSLAFTSGAIVALLLMVSAVVAFPLALDHLGLAPDSQAIISLARWPLLLIILLVALGVLYRFGPSRDAARWPWLSVGAIAAALFWIGGSALFSWYLSNFANYGATYGSLGAAIGLMTWMWMSTIIVLYGAELNFEIERQAALHMPPGASQAVQTFH
jgi:membrane protein